MSEGKYERTYLINVGAQFKYHESQKFKTISILVESTYPLFYSSLMIFTTLTGFPFEFGSKGRPPKKKRVKNGNLAQKVGRYQNKIPI